MLAGEEYKRAAAAGEAPGDAIDESLDMATRALRISWALSRVAPLPVPDLAASLAGALLPLCGRQRAVAVQVGRLVGEADWLCESVGIAGRVCDVARGSDAAMAAFPWPSVPVAGGPPMCLVSQPGPAPACLRPISQLLGSAGLELELAGLACDRRAGALTVTVQVGGDPQRRGSAATGPRAALLRQLLPWMHAIARAALGEGSGRSARDWLTDRERFVLQRLVEGGSVAEIAKTMGRSKYTVHDQVKSLHRKLGVHSRAALVGCATIGVPPPTLDGGAGGDRQTVGLGRAHP